MTNRLYLGNKSGNPMRQIPIPGRNPYQTHGRINFIANYAERGECEWDAIRAAMAAGNVCLQLSPYECDVMLEQFGHDLFPCGPNVSFDLPSTHKVNWRLIAEDGIFAKFSDQTEEGTPQLFCCGVFFESQQAWAGHRRHSHREGELQPHADPKVLRRGRMNPLQIKGSPSVFVR